MLFEAAYWRYDQEHPSLEAGLARPDLVYLFTDWGRAGDTAVIAVTEDCQRVGVAWYRFWRPEQHSYGYISPQIPELGIALQAEFRGMGIGHRLLDSLLETAASQGVERVSLSVEKDNPAIHLYRQHGFEPVEQVDNAWTMLVTILHPG
jgi:ribosomal-protein-alanine N-acetyltransferase